LINKFRGDASLLEPAIKHIEKLTRKRVLGVIPWATINLPDEDSLGSSRSRESEGNTPREFWAWQIQLVAKLVQDNARIDKITEAAGL
jgi:cobyric acid synthase